MSSPILRLGTLVGDMGIISAVKMGDMEREYLLVDTSGVVTWLSHSDIEAVLAANIGSGEKAT